jgi:hypothetical protein
MRPFIALPLAGAIAAASLAGSPEVQAATVVTQTGPNAVRADYALPTPDGRVLRGTFFVEFDTATGLTPAALNIQARVVDPTDPALLARLPAGLPLSIPAAFPVLVSVHPVASSGVQFANAARVEMYTKVLTFSTDSSYRLYKAPAGGAFADLTSAVLPGSIRMRARTGSFSDFLVVEDTRDSAAAAEALYARLAAGIDDDDVPVGTAALLQLDLDDSFEEFEEGDYGDAREELDALELTVDTEAGISLPNVWRAQRDLDNRAGELAALSQALDFHLARLEAASASGDDDGDGDDD